MLPSPFPWRTRGGCDVIIGRNPELTLPARFDFAAAEPRCTQDWGPCALPDARSRFSLTLPGHTPSPWFLPMPPPNITGQLHMGHALFLTLQDIRTRFHAQIGDDALWLPGTDHAGLATHEKILAHMAEHGMDANDRQAYLAQGWAWKDRFHARITGQIRRMGAACDWSRERFTLDDGYQASAREAFARLWHAGLIYRKDHQWWADMRPLAAPLIAAIENGQLQIEPMTSANELLPMLRNIEPWCLSRQIGWGMPIPLKQHQGQWHLDEGPSTPGTPDPDTLDTWFLSSIWPLATLGWPHATADWERYFPGAWMETGDDILFFWIARMWMMGHFLTGQWPFQRLFLHGLVRDKHGRKMSKSLGNGIDPLDIIDQYGADALRWHLALRAQPARDLRFSPQACAADAKWLNKIWQAGRFLQQFGRPNAPLPSSDIPEALGPLTQAWADDLLHDRYPQAACRLQSHFRESFCAGWIEDNKERLRLGDPSLLQQGWAQYGHYLRLLHPFIPFLSTDLHRRLWG